jgi:hypothetical protein
VSRPVSPRSRQGAAAGHESRVANCLLRAPSQASSRVLVSAAIKLHRATALFARLAGCGVRALGGASATCRERGILRGQCADADWLSGTGGSARDQSSDTMKRERTGLSTPIGNCVALGPSPAPGYVERPCASSPAGRSHRLLRAPLAVGRPRLGESYVDLEGLRRASSSDGYWGEGGASTWAPDGREIFFSASEGGAEYQGSSRLTPRRAKRRVRVLTQVHRAPARLALQRPRTSAVRSASPAHPRKHGPDAAPALWVHLARATRRTAISYPAVVGLDAATASVCLAGTDARVVLRTKHSGAVGPDYATCMRKETDGSAVTRLRRKGSHWISRATAQWVASRCARRRRAPADAVSHPGRASKALASCQKRGQSWIATAQTRSVVSRLAPLGPGRRGLPSRSAGCAV